MKPAFFCLSFSLPLLLAALISPARAEVTLGVTSPAYGGGVHPNAAGHAFLAPILLQALLARLSPGTQR